MVPPDQSVRWWELYAAPNRSGGDADTEDDDQEPDFEEEGRLERFAAFAQLLTIREWQVVWLCYGQSISTQAAAEIMGCDYNTARRHKSVAICKLREKLKGRLGVSIRQTDHTAADVWRTAFQPSVPEVLGQDAAGERLSGVLPVRRDAVTAGNAAGNVDAVPSGQTDAVDSPRRPGRLCVADGQTEFGFVATLRPRNQ